MAAQVLLQSFSKGLQHQLVLHVRLFQSVELLPSSLLLQFLLDHQPSLDQLQLLAERLKAPPLHIPKQEFTPLHANLVAVTLLRHLHSLIHGQPLPSSI